MPRDLTAAVLAEIAKAGVRPAVFAEVAFSSGTVNFWSGVGSKSWDSKTWTGVGHFGGIAPVRESTSLSAENFVLMLSGIPTEVLDKCLDEIRYGKTARVWLAFLDEAGNVLADPFEYVGGFTDRAEISENGETATIKLNCENELAALKRPRIRRYTPEDQKAQHPTDLGFDFVPALQELNIVWGGQPIPQQGGGGGTPGGGPNPGELLDGGGGGPGNDFGGPGF
jgi:hypothetical protein